MLLLDSHPPTDPSSITPSLPLCVSSQGAPPAEQPHTALPRATHRSDLGLFLPLFSRKFNFPIPFLSFAAEVCPEQRRPIILPIVVGVVLGLLIVIVVVAYAVGRWRTHHGYQTL